MCVERAVRSDGEAVFSLVRECIRVNYAPVYVPEIIASFHEFHSLQSILSDINNGMLYVLREEEKIVGTVTVDGPHIRRLFVLPAAQHCGYGSALLSFAEGKIAQNFAYAELDASIPGEPFYEKHGYSVREECREEINGAFVQWKVYRKDLSPGSDFGPSAAVSASPSAENFFASVYAVVRSIPRGSVATYGQIARSCGRPRASRAVGYALHGNPTPGEIPCHRVVNREGRLAPAFAFGGPSVQRDLLAAEGVPSVERDGCFYVDLARYGWSGRQK